MDTYYFEGDTHNSNNNTNIYLPSEGNSVGFKSAEGTANNDDLVGDAPASPHDTPATTASDSFGVEFGNVDTGVAALEALDSAVASSLSSTVTERSGPDTREPTFGAQFSTTNQTENHDAFANQFEADANESFGAEPSNRATNNAEDSFLFANDDDGKAQTTKTTTTTTASASPMISAAVRRVRFNLDDFDQDRGGKLGSFESHFDDSIDNNGDDDTASNASGAFYSSHQRQEATDSFSFRGSSSIDIFAEAAATASGDTNEYELETFEPPTASSHNNNVSNEAQHQQQLQNRKKSSNSNKKKSRSKSSLLEESLSNEFESDFYVGRPDDDEDDSSTLKFSATVVDQSELYDEQSTKTLDEIELDDRSEEELQKKKKKGTIVELPPSGSSNAASYDKQPQSQPQQQQQQQQQINKKSFRNPWELLGYIGERRAFTWLFLFCLGIVGGIVAYALETAVRYTFQLRFYLVSLTDIWWAQFAIWVTSVLVVVSLSMLFTHIFSPGDYGAGIPSVKAVLNRAAPTSTLSWNLLVSRALSTPLSVGAGIFLGRLGPTVHMSAIIANYMLKFPLFRKLERNIHLKISMLACSGAIGVSSNFGTPAGGVFFSTEVMGSYYNIKSYWKSFFIAIIATLTTRILHSIIFGSPTILPELKVQLKLDAFSIPELLAFALLGYLFGILAGGFVYLNEKLLVVRQKYGSINVLRIPKTNNKVVDRITSLFETKFLWCIFISMLVAIVTFPGLLGAFMSFSDMKMFENLFSAYELGEGDTHHDWNRGMGRITNLAMLFTLRYILTVLTASLPLPGGFMGPLMIIGASGGRLVGEAMEELFPNGILGQKIQPGGYAMMGAGAMGAGVTQSFSIAFILLEMAGRAYHLPTLVGVISAIWASNKFSMTKFTISIYDMFLRIKNLRVVPEINVADTAMVEEVRVRDIMKRDIVFITQDISVVEIVALLKSPVGREKLLFPVVDSRENKYLIGIISRRELEEYANAATVGSMLIPQQNGDAAKKRGPSVWGPTPSPGSDFSTESSARILQEQADEEDMLSDKYQRELSGVPESPRASGGDAHIDAAPVLPFKSSPFNLVEDAPLSHVHVLFSMFHVDHSFVIKQGRLVGEVTLAALQAALLKKKLSNLLEATTVTHEMEHALKGGVSAEEVDEEEVAPGAKDKMVSGLVSRMVSLGQYMNTAAAAASSSAELGSSGFGTVANTMRKRDGYM